MLLNRKMIQLYECFMVFCSLAFRLRSGIVHFNLFRESDFDFTYWHTLFVVHVIIFSLIYISSILEFPFSFL
jgi:hypothetical protein